MSIAVRSAAAGAALVTMGAMSVSPGVAPVLSQRVSTQAYTLVASSSLLNVPVNMLNMVLSMPGWEVQAMDRFADAMIGTGSWQVWGPTNVFGFDEWDPPKLAGVIDMMIPVQPFSSVLADQVNWWAKANAPMNASCAAAPGACPDFWASASGYLKVPLSQLLNGYQFPAVTNPFTLQPTSWSGQSVTLKPGAAFTSLWNYLSGEPQGVATAPIGDYVTVPLKLAKSMVDAYYPFVQNSEWFNPKTPFSWAFRAIAPLTCPSCGPEPYANPWLYENYPPQPAATRSTPAPAPAAALDGPPSAPAVAVQEPAAPTATPGEAPEPAPDRVVQEPAPDQAVDAQPVTVSSPVASSADAGPVGHRGRAAGGQSSSKGTHEKTRGRSGSSASD